MAALEDFTYKGNAVEFWTKTGEVLDVNKFSETNVRSTPGFVTGNGPPPVFVDSSTSTNMEFWIRKKDGSEDAIQLRDTDIPIRKGHKITMLVAGRKGGDCGWHLALINHSLGRHWYIWNLKGKALSEKLNLYDHTATLSGCLIALFKGILKWGVLTFSILLAAIVHFGYPSFAKMSLFETLLYFLIISLPILLILKTFKDRKDRKEKMQAKGPAVEDQFERHVEDLIQQIYRQEEEKKEQPANA